MLDFGLFWYEASIMESGIVIALVVIRNLIFAFSQKKFAGVESVGSAILLMLIDDLHCVFFRKKTPNFPLNWIHTILTPNNQLLN